MAGILNETGGVMTYQTVAIINQFLASQGIITQGNVWWVRPVTGSDSNNGLSPTTAFKTLSQAQTAAVANQNDVVLMCAEGATASATTDYQSTTLVWAKNLVHLVGINNGPLLGQRSRIAFTSGYVGTGNLFTLSGSNCLIANIEMFMGVASANPVGGLLVSGIRNHIKNCQIAGIGNTANDIAGAYSVNLAGPDENFFEDCTIGLDTVSLSAAANSQILTSTGSQGTGARNIFRKCRILTYAAAAAENVFLRVPASTIDRFLMFDDCVFHNPIQSGATNLTEAAVVNATPGGDVLLTGSNTGVYGASGWNSASNGSMIAISGTPTNSSWGLAVAVTST
jgi:hypothetical protein